MQNSDLLSAYRQASPATTKMHFATLLVLLSASFVALEAGECNSYDREKLNEGYYKCVYKDSRGIPTVGVGFNLKKSGASAEIESVGANYNAVLNGSQCLDDSQIERLFNKDMDSAVGCTSSWVSNWGSLGSDPQSAIADMAFNMGCTKLHGFTDLRTALEDEDYSKAVDAMKDSQWCRQLKSRCDRDVACMR